MAGWGKALLGAVTEGVNELIQPEFADSDGEDESPALIKNENDGDDDDVNDANAYERQNKTLLLTCSSLQRELADKDELIKSLQENDNDQLRESKLLDAEKQINSLQQQLVNSDSASILQTKVSSLEQQLRVSESSNTELTSALEQVQKDPSPGIELDTLNNQLEEKVKTLSDQLEASEEGRRDLETLLKEKKSEQITSDSTEKNDCDGIELNNKINELSEQLEASEKAREHLAIQLKENGEDHANELSNIQETDYNTITELKEQLAASELARAHLLEQQHESNSLTEDIRELTDQLTATEAARQHSDNQLLEMTAAAEVLEKKLSDSIDVKNDILSRLEASEESRTDLDNNDPQLIDVQRKLTACQEENKALNELILSDSDPTEVSALAERVGKLQEEVDHQKSLKDNQSDQGKVSKLEDQLSQLQSSHNTTLSDYSTLTDEKSSLLKKLSKLEDEVEKLSNDTSEVIQFRDENQSLKAELEVSLSQREQLSQLQSSHYDVVNDNSTLRSTIEDLQSKIGITSTEKEALQEAHVTILDENGSLRSEVEVLSSDKLILQEQCDSFTEAANSSNELEFLQQIDSLKQEIENLNINNDKLLTTESENRSLKDVTARDESKIASLETEIKQLKTETDTLRSDNVILLEEKKETDENMKLNQTNEQDPSANDFVEELKERLSLVQSENEKLVSDKDTLTAQIDVLECESQEMFELKGLLQSTDDELQKANSALSERDEDVLKVTKLNEDIVVMQNNLSESEQIRQSLENEIQSLNAELQQQQQLLSVEATPLQQQASDSLAAENASLDQKVTSLTEVLSDKNDEVKTLQQQRIALEQQLQALEESGKNQKQVYDTNLSKYHDWHKDNSGKYESMSKLAENRKEELNQQFSKLDDYRTQVRQLNESLKQQGIEVMEMKELCDVKSTELSKTKQILRDVVSENEILQNSLLDNEDSESQSSLTITRLTTQLKDVTSQLHRCEDESNKNAALQEKLRLADSNYIDMENKLNHKVADLESNLSLKEDEITELGHQIDAIHTDDGQRISELRVSNEKIINLQSVLDHFIADKESEILKRTDSLMSDMCKAQQQLHESNTMVSTRTSELEEVRKGMAKEIGSKNSIIQTLQNKLAYLRKVHDEVMLKADPESSINKKVISKLILSYITKIRNREQTADVLRIISSAMNWTEDENETSGLTRKQPQGTSWWQALTPSKDNDANAPSLSDMWVNFLLKETDGSDVPPAVVTLKSDVEQLTAQTPDRPTKPSPPPPPPLDEDLNGE